MAHVHAEARPVSRAQLTAALKVTRGKVSAEVAELIGAGFLAEQGLAQSDGGRRSSLLGSPRSAGLILAVDLGATSVDVALTTLGSEILAHRSEPTDVRFGPGPVLEGVKALVAELLEEQGTGREEILAVGLGLPGPVEQTTGLLTVPPIMPGWDRFPIREVLLREYAAPVVVDNDVNVMALGEHWGGVGRGVDDMLFVKIGTGIGSGIIIGGKPYRGPQGCAGDLGHVMVDPDGPTCACGNRGCLEAMAAAPAMVARAERCARDGRSEVLAGIGGEGGKLSARDIGEAARRGDACALDVIRRTGGLVGQTLASVVSVLNPSLIVIGGGVSHIGNALLAEIRSSVYRRSLPLATRNLPVVMSELDDVAGVVGASVMAAQGVLAVRN